ncbi:PepSY domain-containing protein [Parabacteroides faecis]|uniref:PepSY-associated TM helix domain-containing protein n=1 Tax=Parabacteroides faecis TaxID=1217282 RepID=UPI00216428B9|nr:PepSY-associated TM helix domain-containing protein [Parabacteroides faecis]UVQ49389.1 PepSY domain-containing protein [Parabacteroides faecis]
MHNYILKKILVNTHLYIGLILGLVITLICVSGSAIVYKPELEKLSVKKLAFVEPSDRIIPLQYLLDNVRKKYPQLTISNMVLYGGKDCAYSFRATSPDEKGRIQVYVNQYTGEVLGIDRYRHKIFQWLYDLHVKLLLKKERRCMGCSVWFLTDISYCFRSIFISK